MIGGGGCAAAFDVVCEKASAGSAVSFSCFTYESCHSRSPDPASICDHIHLWAVCNTGLSVTEAQLQGVSRFRSDNARDQSCS